MKKIMMLVILLLGSSMLFGQSEYQKFLDKAYAIGTKDQKQINDEYNEKRKRNQEYYANRERKAIVNYFDNSNNDNSNSWTIQRDNFDKTTTVYENRNIRYEVKTRYGSDDKDIYKYNRNGTVEKYRMEKQYDFNSKYSTVEYRIVKE